MRVQQAGCQKRGAFAGGPFFIPRTGCMSAGGRSRSRRTNFANSITFLSKCRSRERASLQTTKLNSRNDTKAGADEPTMQTHFERRRKEYALSKLHLSAVL